MKSMKPNLRHILAAPACSGVASSEDWRVLQLLLTLIRNLLAIPDAPAATHTGATVRGGEREEERSKRKREGKGEGEWE